MSMIMQEQRPYVEFYYAEKEDRNASVSAGMYVPMNVAMVKIIPVGGKNEHVEEADEWFRKKREAASQGRFNREWLHNFEQMFKMFKEGEEIPENGIAIRSCLMFSPAEQRAVLNANIRTLEDLAGCTEEGLRAMGPGGRALRDRARTAIEQSKDSGKIAREMENLKVTVEEQKRQIEELMTALRNSGVEPKRGPGRPPKADTQ